MEHVGPQVVLRRIDEAAKALGNGVVALDGDGTTWSGDVGEDLFFALLERADVRPLAAEALEREASQAGIDPSGSGAALARRLFDAYTEGRYPERRICEVIAWLCAGWSRAELDAFAQNLLTREAFESRLHPGVLEVIRGVRERGHRVVLVSASPRAVVVVAGRFAGVHEVVAATPLFTNDTIQAAVDLPIPYDHGKIIRLRELVGRSPLLAALGDNAFDVPMLIEARVAVAVRPKPRLLARAEEVPGLLALTDALADRRGDAAGP